MSSLVLNANIGTVLKKTSYFIMKYPKVYKMCQSLPIFFSCHASFHTSVECAGCGLYQSWHLNRVLWICSAFLFPILIQKLALTPYQNTDAFACISLKTIYSRHETFVGKSNIFSKRKLTEVIFHALGQ